ncbi:hypothetical protein [Owenweeksia hongkongensis]|uniref:hypothetical protein n=1 Tax=Owenweeksia hongkongensis TaxID=253245 RepID=UPI003A8EBA05
MNSFKKTILIAASILIIIQLFIFDYQDLRWGANSSAYISIVAMLLVVISMILSNRNERKETDS